MNFAFYSKKKERKCFQVITHFFSLEKGAIVLSFAIMLPFYIAFLALAIDGTMLLSKKARLADSLNEAVLVIAATNNYNETVDDLRQNLQVVDDFLQFYVPDAHYLIDDLGIKVKVQDGGIGNMHSGYVDYRITAKVSVDTILPLSQLNISGFNPTVEVSNYNTNSGNARKYAAFKPVDMVLVVDFSRSMNEETAQDLAGTAQAKRIDILKSVVSRVINKALDIKGTRIAIVPFDIGVPVQSSHINEFGRQDLECSLLFVPKESHKIDYGFWSNKFVDVKRNIYESTGGSLKANEIMYHMDNARFQYYMNIFLPGHSELNNNMDKLVNGPFSFCTLNGNESISKGYAKYSCEWNAINSIFTVANKNLIKNEYDKVVLNLKSMRSAVETENGLGYISIANIDSVDIEKTIDGMFDKQNVVHFIQPWAPNMIEHRMFSEMCQSGMGQSLITPTENVIREKDDYDHGNRLTVAEAYQQLVSVKNIDEAPTYLIPLTANKDDLAVFNNMTPGGGTDIMSGLLRALPVLAEGNNANKVIVIISDGEDLEGPKRLSDEFLKHNLCDRIRSDIKYKTIPETKNLDMFFISVNSNYNNKERLKYWADNCVGSGNAILAESYEELMAVFEAIVQVETGYFINDCDSNDETDCSI